MDKSKFFIELLNPEKIGKTYIDEMYIEQVHVYAHISWGQGIGLHKGRTEKAVWHWGNFDNIYHSLAIIYTGSNTGIIIMTKGNLVCKDIAHKAIDGDNSLFSFVYPVQFF